MVSGVRHDGFASKRPDAFSGCSSSSAFLAILSVILIYLILGENSGVFVTSVADNVMKFAGAVPTPSLIGIGVILAHHLSGDAAPALDARQSGSRMAGTIRTTTDVGFRI